MIINDKKWKQLEDKEKIAYCEELFKSSKEAIQQNHFEWYLNYLFIDGQHYAAYNTTTNRLEQAPRKKGEVRIVVNKVKSIIRAIKNYCTRQKPKWEVIPGDIDEDTISNARRCGKFLDYLYRKLHLEQYVSGVVDSALNTSVAWTELDWDDKAASGLGQVKVKLHDSYDVFPDSRAYLEEGKYKGAFLAVAVKRTVSEIKNDKKYIEANRKEVKPDDKPSASDIKDRLIKKDTSSSQDKVERATVKQFFLYDDEGNSKKGNLQLFTYAGETVLRDEELKNKEYPMYCMQIDMKPNKLYQRSWTADMIPLNKALDRNISQKIMYVNQALVYRIIAEKGHGTAEIDNNMGTTIEINKNRKFEQMQMHPLPSTVDTLTNDLVGFVEDVAGAHEASLGGVSSAARSGKLLESAQAADSNNLSGIIDSLNSYLAVLGEAILEMVSEKYVASRIIKLTEPENGQEYAKVIGSSVGKGKYPKGAIVVGDDNEIIVSIGSWLGYTRDAQRETLLKLVELQIIPPEEVLRQFEFANVDDLSAKARDYRLEQGQMDLAIAGRTQNQENQNQMTQLADQEMMEMMNGNQIPPTEGATQEHLQAEMDFVNTATFTQADPQTQQLIQTHIQGEQQMMGMMA